MNYFDGRLSFNLDNDYIVETAENDDGEEFLNIKYNVTQDDEGNEHSEHSFMVKKLVLEGPGEENFMNLIGEGKTFNSNFDNVVQGTITSTTVLVTINMAVFMVLVKKDSDVFVFTGKAIAINADDDIIKAKLDDCAEIFSNVVNSTEIDGVEIEMDGIDGETIFNYISDDYVPNSQEEEGSSLEGLLGSVDKLAKTASDISGELGETDFPYATPGENQHEHLDFQQGTKNKLGLFGGMLQINQTGTEYSFNDISEYYGYDTEEREKLAEEIGDDVSNFELANTAKKYSRVFRVSANAFNESEDREQEILAGYLRRAYMYDGFRSFAWTVAAYCDKNNLEVKDLDLQLLREIADFVVDRDYLNYDDSYCKGLCSGGDIHVYFVPDGYCDEETLDTLTDGEIDGFDIQSLDELRKDLEFLYPAMKLIHDDFDEYRDEDVALEGSLEDVLYAWCSMTYAARNAIFTEDGPMTCDYKHPNKDYPWEIQARKEWMKKHSKYLSDAKIIIKDKKFVFSGMEYSDEWAAIFEKFTEMGGIKRTAVSGQTDYLVCDPKHAGDSSVKKAREQQIKGKNVKIVLVDRFLEALGMAKEKEEPRAKKERPLPDLSKMEYPHLTYKEGKKFENEKYSILIPDGFEILEDEDDRDFIAYIPNDNPDDSYLDSNFVIFAGRELGNAPDEFKTPECFVAFGELAMGATTAASFGKVKNSPYLRRDMPGSISYSFDNSGRIGFRDNTIHANACVAVGDSLKMMRVQINEVPVRYNAAYEEYVVKMIFDNMRPKNPVSLVDDIDDSKYLVSNPSKSLVDELKDCISDHMYAISALKNFKSNFVINQFKEKQSSGLADIDDLKAELQTLIDEIGSYVDSVLEKCEKVFNYYLDNDVENSILTSLKDAISSVVDFSDQAITINNGELRFANQSEYAKNLLSHLETPEERKKRLAKESEATKKAEQEKAAKEKARIEAEKKRAEQLAKAREIKKQKEEERKRQEALRKERERKEQEEKRRKEALEEQRRLEEERIRKEEAAKKENIKLIVFAVISLIAGIVGAIVVKSGGTLSSVLAFFGFSIGTFIGLVKAFIIDKWL